MKKILLILIPFFYSCGPSLEEIDAHLKAQKLKEKELVNTNPVKTVKLQDGMLVKTIDSCEYLLYPQTFMYVTGGAYDAQRIINYEMIHKGNCRYCLIRYKLKYHEFN